jgi:hypothetical protein
MAATPKLYEAACKGTHISQGGSDDDANLVFDSTGGGGRSTVLLPYNT